MIPKTDMHGDPGVLRLPDGSVPDIYFVDLDGTLVSRSSEKTFLVSLVRNGVLGPIRLLGFLSGYLLHPLLSLREGKGWNRLYLRGVDPEEAAERAADCAEELLAGSLRAWTSGSIEELGQAGCRVIIVSASLCQITSVIADKLGVEEIRASEPELKGGRFTGRLAGSRPWGRKKLEIASEICGESGTDLQRCAAAGDSWSDRLLLRRCGCPVAVCPDRRLEAMAEREGWRIVEGRHTRWA